MKRIFLCDLNGQKQNPYLVRYFKYRDSCYLIYTFHEIDENQFMTLYIVKVIEESSSHVAKYLSDNQEWEKMRDAIKQMLGEIINKQIVSFEDMNVDTNFVIQMEKARSFKLLATLVETLSGNYMDEEKEEADAQQKALEKPNANNNEKRSAGNSLSRIAEEKISVIECLKQKYQLKKQKDKPLPVIEISLLDICPIISIENGEEKVVSAPEEKEISFNSMNDPLQEEFEHTMVDSVLYRKLQEENEMLKQQLLQYQVKYETLKSLLRTA